MTSEALKTFARNEARLEDLLSFYQFGTGNQRGRPTKDCSELGRAAIAQAVSCFDAYLHDVLAERLERSIGRGNWNQRLVEAANELADGKTLLTISHSASGKTDLAKAIGGRFDSRPLQKQARVEEVLELLGVGDPWARIEHHFRTTPRGVRTQKDMQGRLKGIVERRNQIVHRADVPKGSEQAKRMRKTEASKARLFLQKLVEAIDMAILEV